MEKTTDFYCQRHQCHMTYSACVRRQKLIQAKPAIKQGGPTCAKDLIVRPELCQDCPQGQQVAQLLAQQKADQIRQPAETGTNSTCLWPGCKNPAQSTLLCNTCFKAAKKNTLLKLNTRDTNPDALKVLLKQLVLIAENNDLSIEDVGIACLHQGVQQYFRAREKKGGEK
ncbi:MAG: hypothetical protein ACOC1Q_01885 [Desulfosalsimonas sp.]